MWGTKNNLVGWDVLGIILPSCVEIFKGTIGIPIKPPVWWKLAGFFSWLKKNGSNFRLVLKGWPIPQTPALVQLVNLPWLKCFRHVELWPPDERSTWELVGLVRAVPVNTRPPSCTLVLPAATTDSIRRHFRKWLKNGSGCCLCRVPISTGHYNKLVNLMTERGAEGLLWVTFSWHLLT